MGDLNPPQLNAALSAQRTYCWEAGGGAGDGCCHGGGWDRAWQWLW